MTTNTFRGHDIHREGREWLFSDTNAPVASTWKLRPCGYCNFTNTQEGHDGCFGRLPGVMNACCGHGDSRLAYIQFTAGLALRGFIARWTGLAIRRITRMVQDEVIHET